MRRLSLIPLACLLAGCLAPGERDPTRYPWDPRNKPALSAVPHPRIEARGVISPDAGWHTQPQPLPQPIPPPGTYCVIALESRSTGITVNGNAMAMSACSVPANSAPNPAPANPPPR